MTCEVCPYLRVSYSVSYLGNNGAHISLKRKDWGYMGLCCSKQRAERTDKIIYPAVPYIP